MRWVTRFSGLFRVFSTEAVCKILTDSRKWIELEKEHSLIQMVHLLEKADWMWKAQLIEWAKRMALLIE